MNAGPERPWLQRPEWEGGVVRLRRRHGLVAHWFGAVVWNVLSVPLLVGTWRRPSELAALPVPGRLVIAAWVLFGLFLATRAVVVTLRARRFRDSVLSSIRFPERGTVRWGEASRSPHASAAKRERVCHFTASTPSAG